MKGFVCVNIKAEFSVYLITCEIKFVSLSSMWVKNKWKKYKVYLHLPQMKHTVTHVPFR